MTPDEKKVRLLKSDANIFMLAYELEGGRDLQLLRHSIDSLRQAQLLQAKSDEQNTERGL